MFEMKKNIIATLLVLAISMVGIFAVVATGATGEFDVVTNVGGIHEIKLVAVGTAVPTNKGGFDGLPADNSDFTVTDTNYSSVQTVRQLISMSNNRNGYYMTLSATAMKTDLGSSESAYINYDVTAGGASLTTNGATSVDAAANIYESGSLTGMNFYSTDVTVKVKAEEYENAVTGSYSGTITFNLFAN
jgi:hypothetical protein